jgi:hypothetical protein
MHHSRDEVANELTPVPSEAESDPYARVTPAIVGQVSQSVSVGHLG